MAMVKAPLLVTATKEISLTCAKYCRRTAACTHPHNLKHLCNDAELVCCGMSMTIVSGPTKDKSWLVVHVRCGKCGTEQKQTKLYF